MYGPTVSNLDRAIQSAEIISDCINLSINLVLLREIEKEVKSQNG